jgi:hypothetical protein
MPPPKPERFTRSNDGSPAPGAHPSRGRNPRRALTTPHLGDDGLSIGAAVGCWLDRYELAGLQAKCSRLDHRRFIARRHGTPMHIGTSWMPRRDSLGCRGGRQACGRLVRPGSEPAPDRCRAERHGDHGERSATSRRGHYASFRSFGTSRHHRSDPAASRARPELDRGRRRVRYDSLWRMESRPESTAVKARTPGPLAAGARRRP